MTVGMVVALDERRHEDPRIGQRPEPVRKHRGELQRREPRPRVRVDSTHARPGVRRKRPPNPTTTPRRSCSSSTVRVHDGAGDIAGEDVDHHAAVEVLPLNRTGQLRDIPAQHLAGGGSTSAVIRSGRWLSGPVGGYQRLLGGVSSPCEPLEISSKSSCAFPKIPRATSVIPQRRCVTASCRRRHAISASSGVNRPIFSPGFRPARTPASRSLRH